MAERLNAWVVDDDQSFLLLGAPCRGIFGATDRERSHLDAGQARGDVAWIPGTLRSGAVVLLRLHDLHMEAVADAWQDA